MDAKISNSDEMKNVLQVKSIPLIPQYFFL